MKSQMRRKRKSILKKTEEPQSKKSRISWGANEVSVFNHSVEIQPPPQANAPENDQPEKTSLAKKEEAQTPKERSIFDLNPVTESSTSQSDLKSITNLINTFYQVDEKKKGNLVEDNEKKIKFPSQLFSTPEKLENEEKSSEDQDVFNLKQFMVDSVQKSIQKQKEEKDSKFLKGIREITNSSKKKWSKDQRQTFGPGDEADIISEAQEDGDNDSVNIALQEKFNQVDSNSQNLDFEKKQIRSGKKKAEEIDLLGDLESDKKQSKKEFNSEIKHLDAIQNQLNFNVRKAASFSPTNPEENTKSRNGKMDIEREMPKKIIKNSKDQDTTNQMNQSDMKRQLKNKRLSRVEEDEALPEKIMKRSKTNFEEYSMDSNLVNQKILENRIRLNEQNLSLFDDNDLKSIIDGSFDSNNEFSNFRFSEQKSKFEQFMDGAVDVPKQLLKQYKEIKRTNERNFGSESQLFNELTNSTLIPENISNLTKEEFAKNLKGAFNSLLNSSFSQLMTLTSKIKVLKDNIRLQDKQKNTLEEILAEALQEAKEGDLIRVNDIKMKHLMEFFSQNFGLKLQQMGCKNKAQNHYFIRATIGGKLVVDFTLRKGASNFYIIHAECSLLMGKLNYYKKNVFSDPETWKTLINRFIYVEIDDPRESPFQEFVIFLSSQVEKLEQLAKELDRCVMIQNIDQCTFDKKTGVIFLEMICLSNTFVSFIFKINCFQEGIDRVQYMFNNRGLERKYFKLLDSKELKDNLDLAKNTTYNTVQGVRGGYYLESLMERFKEYEFEFRDNKMNVKSARKRRRSFGRSSSKERVY